MTIRPYSAIASGMRYTLVLSLAWLCCASAAKVVQAQRLHTREGISLPCRLVSLSASGWQFEGQPEVPLDGVVRWGMWPATIKQQAVWLADGSWLVGEVQIVNGKTAKIHSDWLQIPEIDLGMIRCLVYSPPASAAQWREMQFQIESLQGRQDCVWLNGNQRVLGVLRWPSGGQEALTQRLTLESGAQNTEIDIVDVQAVVFSPALFGSAPSAMPRTLGLADGTLLRDCELVVSSTSVRLKLASGLELESLDSSKGFASAVRYIAGKPTGTTFLSDLKPADYRNLSDTKLIWQFGSNRDVYGRHLLVPEGFVERGLSLHSSSQIAYRWNGSPAHFVAEVCLAARDPRMSVNLGSATCRVLLARNGKLEQVHQVELTRRPADQAQQAEFIDIDIGAAQLVVLVAEKADFGQYADQVFWLDARIAQQP